MFRPRRSVLPAVAVLVALVLVVLFRVGAGASISTAAPGAGRAVESQGSRGDRVDDGVARSHAVPSRVRSAHGPDLGLEGRNAPPVLVVVLALGAVAISGSRTVSRAGAEAVMSRGPPPAAI